MDPQPATPETSAPDPRRRLLRRILPLLLIGGLAMWYFRDAPRDVTLVYNLEARREGLQALVIDLREADSGRVARHVEFRYSPQTPAPREQTHPVRLEPGAYRLEASLDYGGRTETVTRSLDFGEEERITIRL